MAETSSAKPPPDTLYYVGRFGLGHRLSKLSAALHLARTLHLSEVNIHWGSCQTNQDIFAHLFGRSTSYLLDGTFRNLTILVRNDVAGYYAGQNYKNARQGIPVQYCHDQSPWRHKLDADARFFSELLERFLTLHPQVQEFARDWKSQQVIGLHLRAGNGEGDHFVESQRGVPNSTAFVRNLCGLLNQMSASLLFLATDTPAMISMVNESCSMPVVTYAQTRVAQGVSYSVWKEGEECMQGWLDSMSDMALLALSDVVVAGMRSTFTQILPRSIVQRSGKQYCEVDQSGTRMTCWKDELEWLFRTKEGIHHGKQGEVDHKVMVHLPDVVKNEWLERARQFVSHPSANNHQFVFGEAIDKTYRVRDAGYTDQWTWLT